MSDRLVEDVLRAADGDEVAFARVCRHPRIARMLDLVSRRFYAPGHERQDFAQEARVALLVAVRYWDAQRGAEGFEGFAAMVVKRRLQSTLKMALAGKHRPLAEAMDLDSPSPSAWTDGVLADVLPGGVDPVAQVLAREELAAVLRVLPRLSELERRAIGMLLSGKEYTASKSLDNAMQRARRKLRAVAA